MSRCCCNTAGGGFLPTDPPRYETFCYKAIANGTGYSIDDIIYFTLTYDPPTASLPSSRSYYNSTTDSTIATPPREDLGDCGNVQVISTSLQLLWDKQANGNSIPFYRIIDETGATLAELDETGAAYVIAGTVVVPDYPETITTGTGTVSGLAAAANQNVTLPASQRKLYVTIVGNSTCVITFTPLGMGALTHTIAPNANYALSLDKIDPYLSTTVNFNNTGSNSLDIYWNSMT